MLSAITAIAAPPTNIPVERKLRLRVTSVGATLISLRIRPRLNTQPAINSNAPSSRHDRIPSFRLFEKTAIAQSTTANKIRNAMSLAQTVGSCSATFDVAKKNTPTRITARTEITPAPNQSLSAFVIVLLRRIQSDVPIYLVGSHRCMSYVYAFP